MSIQGTVGEGLTPSSRRFPGLLLLVVGLLAFLGTTSLAFVASFPSLPQAIRDYDRLSTEHIGAVDRAASFLQPPVADVRAFAWMACADDWLLHGSAEYGPGGLVTFPVQSAPLTRLVQDLSMLESVETTLADRRLPDSERSQEAASFDRLLPQVRADEARLRTELGLAPVSDVGVAPHVLARCGAY